VEDIKKIHLNKAEDRRLAITKMNEFKKVLGVQDGDNNPNKI
jgi:hypothetical protein